MLRCFLMGSHIRSASTKVISKATNQTLDKSHQILHAFALVWGLNQSSVINFNNYTHSQTLAICEEFAWSPRHLIIGSLIPEGCGAAGLVKLGVLCWALDGKLKRIGAKARQWDWGGAQPWSDWTEQIRTHENGRGVGNLAPRFCPANHYD